MPDSVGPRPRVAPDPFPPPARSSGRATAAQCGGHEVGVAVLDCHGVDSSVTHLACVLRGGRLSVALSD